MEGFEKQIIRRFTRKDPERYEERKEVAAEIRADRNDFFTEQKDLQENVAHLQKAVIEKGETLESLARQLENARVAFGIAEEKFMSWILQRSEKRRLSEKIVGLEEAQGRLEAQYADFAEALEVAKQQRVTSNGLDDARTKLRAFQGKTVEEINAFIRQEKKDRDVKGVMERHGVFFVHAIQDRSLPGSNSLLEPGTDWRDKFKMAFAFEPTLSTSTIRPGIDSTRQLFASTMGILLGGGHVELASFQDAGTRAAGIKTRHLNRDGIDNLFTPGRQEIALAISGGSSERGYNELVVSEPQPVALFIAVEQKGAFIGPVHDQGAARFSDFTKFAEEIGVPWYAFKNGHIYEAEQMVSDFPGPFGSQQVRHLNLGREIKPDELTKRDKPIDAEKRKQWAEEVLIDPPFQRQHMPEATLIEARAYGRTRYLDLAAIAGRLPEEGETIHSVGYSYFYKRQGDGAEITRTIRRPERDTQPSHSYRIGGQRYDSSEGTLGPGFGNSREKLITVQAYLRETRRVRDEYMPHAASIYYQHSINALAYQTYGFAEQAAALGDEVAAREAFALAASIIPQPQYEEVKKRRLDENGRYRLHKEDLEKMN